jgi:hypothetical protein
MRPFVGLLTRYIDGIDSQSHYLYTTRRGVINWYGIHHLSLCCHVQCSALKCLHKGKDWKKVVVALWGELVSRLAFCYQQWGNCCFTIIYSSIECLVFKNIYLVLRLNKCVRWATVWTALLYVHVLELHYTSCSLIKTVFHCYQLLV